MPPSGTAVYNGSVKLPWSPDGENLLGSGLFGGASPGREYPRVPEIARDCPR